MCGVMAMIFTPPSPPERLRAIGNTSDLPRALQRALDPAAFAPIPAPGPNDWLANHDEAGQTFDEFVRSHANRPDAARHTIYLQPLGDFAQSTDSLRDFAAAFFMMPVQALPSIP